MAIPHNYAKTTPQDQLEELLMEDDEGQIKPSSSYSSSNEFEEEEALPPLTESMTAVSVSALEEDELDQLLGLDLDDATESPSEIDAETASTPSEGLDGDFLGVEPENPSNHATEALESTVEVLDDTYQDESDELQAILSLIDDNTGTSSNRDVADSENIEDLSEADSWQPDTEESLQSVPNEYPSGWDDVVTENTEPSYSDDFLNEETVDSEFDDNEFVEETTEEDVSDFISENGDNSPENMEEDSNTENDDTAIPSSSEPVDTKPTLMDRLKNRIALIKTQIRADMKGEEIPDASPHDNIHDESEESKTDIYNDDKSELPKPLKKQKSNSDKTNNVFKKILAKLKKPYIFLTGFVFKIVKAVLGVLTKIPFFGKFLKPLLEATKTLERVAMILPLVALIILLSLVNYFSVPGSFKTDLPDKGAASFQQFEYESSTNEAVGVIYNTGETIADVVPEFTVYTLQPGWNPLSWFMYKEAGKCEAVPVSVDIDDSQEVHATCQVSGGLFPRVSGGLK